MFFTARNNIPGVGRLGQGETLPIQGGTSGVGLAGLQLARQLRGAHTLANCSTEAKAA